ncbi:MAG TPA: STAS domain-containing protein [Jatrophihabitans sp.]
MFSTDVTRDGDTTVLALAGELDIATVAELRELAYAELDRADCRALVLDLAELTFLDSTGIGCWVQVRTHAASADKQVVIRSVPVGVRRVLEISGLLPLFS